MILLNYITEDDVKLQHYVCIIIIIIILLNKCKIGLQY